ncbi:MAG: transglycosylase domain-containing protein, partial [Coriobacteriales bacterium]|nr:transglycosylase domain-containing protein [Coriobacteriales bacterium]
MSVRTRRARKHSRTHIVGFGLAGVLGFIALLLIALALSVGALVDSWLQNLPDYTSADAYLVAEPTDVYDANGNTIAEYYLQNRRSVTQDEVSPYVLEGTVDTEDVRFYQHNGVDPQGIARAIVVQFTGGSEGASTITQQLVRNTVLSNEQFEQTLKRKVREAYIAIQMEKMYSKDQILMMYLNTIYYGHSAYGIEAASITYFNKDAKDLTLAEAALLAGLPQSPTYYDPTVNPEAAVTRRNTVLDRMLTAGDITQEEHDEAQAEPLTLNEGTVMDATGTYPYFTDYVKTLLLQDFDQETILKGGLKVYTTIDPDMQAAAEKAVTDRLNSIGNSKLQSALVAVDPSNGYIKAMVGGRDYSSNQYNMATQAARQPGSSFKTFTLTAALSQGMNPDILLNCNSPQQILSTWRVQNFDNFSYGTVTLRTAIALSSNTGLAQVAV